MTGSILIKPAYGTYSGTNIVLLYADTTITKSANLMEMPMPLSDSNLTDVFDFMGCTRKVNIDGTFTGNTGSIQGFAGSLFGLIQGGQTWSTLTTDAMAGSILVKTNDFSYDYVMGNPNSIKYSLKLIETTSTS